MARYSWAIAGAAVIAAALIVRQVGWHAANKVVDRDIDKIIATLPPGVTAHYARTETNPLTGTVTLRDVTLSYHGAPAWSADAVTLAGADQAGLHAVFDPSAYPGGHPASARNFPLLETFAITNLRLIDPHDSTNKISIGSVSVTGLSGRQFFEPPAPENTRTRAFAADAALALAVQSFELRDATATSADASVHLGSALLRDFDHGKFSRASLENMVIDNDHKQQPPSRQHAEMAKIEARSYDLTALLTAARDHAANLPSIKSSDGEPASLSANKFALTIANGPSLAIGSCHGESMPADPPGLPKGKFACRDIVLDVGGTKLDPAVQASIDAFGMHSLTMDVSAEAATDPRTNHVKLNEELDLHDLAQLHLGASTTMHPPTSGQVDAEAALANTLVDHAELVWTDEGFTNRVFAAAAARMHTTSETVRAQLAIPLVSLGFLVPDQPDLVDQITAFLNHPNTLTVTLNPPQPFSLAAIGRAPADQKARLMGLRVKAN